MELTRRDRSGRLRGSMGIDAVCPRCAAPVARDAAACASCGYVRPPLAQTPRPMPVPTDERAIAATVLAVVGIAVPFVCSLAAIVLGRRAQRSIAAGSGGGGRTMAAIGVWLGAFGLGSWIVVAALIALR